MQRRRVGVWLVLGVIAVYRLVISPLKGSNSCRFLPTCSDYAREAVLRYGVCKGGMLAAKRILRCRPGGSHGIDNVP